MPHRIAAHPIFTALGTVAQRLSEIPAVGWLLSLVVAAANAVLHDIFTGIYILAGCFSLADLRWGALVARQEGRYDPARKSAGRSAKIITLGLLLGLRGLEWWASSWGILDIPALLNLVGLSGLSARAAAVGGGFISALLCVAVVYDEVKSWDTHRRRLGAGRIPFLSALLAIGDGANARILAAAKAHAERDDDVAAATALADRSLHTFDSPRLATASAAPPAPPPAAELSADAPGRRPLPLPSGDREPRP